MHGNAQRLLPIEAPALALPGIAHAFFTREGGVSTGIYRGLNTGIGSKDERQAGAGEPRPRRAPSRGKPGESRDALSGARHRRCGGRGGMGTRPRPEGRRGGDTKPGIAVGVGAADCGPVLFADPKARVVAAAHAGWKGALSGVLESTIAKMEELGAKRPDIVAVLGPTISASAYEVGPEFVRPLRRGRRKKRPLLPRFRARRAFDVRPARLSSSRGLRQRASAARSPLALAPIPTRRASIPIAAPRIAANPTTAGCSPRSC